MTYPEIDNQYLEVGPPTHRIITEESGNDTYFTNLMIRQRVNGVLYDFPLFTSGNPNTRFCSELVKSVMEAETIYQKYGYTLQ